MDKENKYYGIIENLVRQHRKFDGFEPIIEDIIDSGNTLKTLKLEIEKRNPKTLMIVTLLDKPDRREVEVDVDITGFVIPDEFVVGFGLDYDQKYRNLPYIGVVEI